MRITSYIVAVLLVFAGGYYTAEQKYQAEITELITEQGDSFTEKRMFRDVWKILQEKYVDPEVFSEDKLFEYGVIKGLVSGLEDPFSVFMTPEENESFMESLHGEFEGIGAELTMRMGAITVVTPLKGSPAKEAGLMPEDIIISVNEEDIQGQILTEVVKKIRGEKGTDVTLTVFRPSMSDTMDITITRDVITIASVESEMKDDIAYIELNQFGDDTVKAFTQQFANMLENTPKGMIIDLRFNGGGYLDAAIDIASFFLEDKSDVVKVETRDNGFMHKSNKTLLTNTEIPLIILINKGSASASEILSGALQDHKRALILGEQSFGKGSVQEVVPLSQGAALKLTIAKWITPSGNIIQDAGVTPDLVVEKTREDFENNTNPQLDKALEILNAGNIADYFQEEVAQTN